METPGFVHSGFPFCSTSFTTTKGIGDRRYVSATYSSNVRLVNQNASRRSWVTAMSATGSSSKSVSSLKSSLRNALEGLNYGLNIDADAETMTEEEGEVCHDF